MQQNILTLDVEEYYHAENVARSLSPIQLERLESRVVVGTSKALAMLGATRARATFFVLGCVAERHPDLVRAIAAAGHEISSHGHLHVPFHDHTPQSFEADLARSLEILTPLAGQAIRGFRATSFSLPADAAWFYGCLARHGIEYDSSRALSWFRPNDNRTEQATEVTEYPVSCIERAGVRLPCGGGYFRAFPYWLTRSGLRACARRGVPFVFYLHPWELDPAQPRLSLPGLRGLRHYWNLASTEQKLAHLLSQHRFMSFRQLREQTA